MSEGDEVDEDEMAAWGAATAAPARSLSQGEIDDLLGFGDAAVAPKQESGLHQVVQAGLVSYERLPMLEIVFDRLVRILSTSLRLFTSDNVEVSIEKLNSIRFGDFIDSIPLPTMLSVFRAAEWENYGLMVIDAPMIYTIVDVLLGGRRGTAPVRIEGRPYTTIERSLVEKMVRQVLSDLAVSFDPVCRIKFEHERTEVNPRFATITRPSSAAIVARIKIELDERGGCFDIALPYATLEPVRDMLLQQFMGERYGRDTIWESHLADELHRTDIELDAVLGTQTMFLSDVLNLRVGSQLVLAMTADDPVELQCGGITLFKARTGNRRNRVAVQIEDRLPRAINSVTTGLGAAPASNAAHHPAAS